MALERDCTNCCETFFFALRKYTDFFLRTPPVNSLNVFKLLKYVNHFPRNWQAGSHGVLWIKAVTQCFVVIWNGSTHRAAKTWFYGKYEWIFSCCKKKKRRKKSWSGGRDSLCIAIQTIQNIYKYIYTIHAYSSIVWLRTLITVVCFRFFDLHVLHFLMLHMSIL